jgi:hypothetical protein
MHPSVEVTNHERRDGEACHLADRLIQEPEVRGVRDDVKEAVLQAGFSLASTIIASFVIRRVVSTRWGK